MMRQPHSQQTHDVPSLGGVNHFGSHSDPPTYASQSAAQHQQPVVPMGDDKKENDDFIEEPEVIPEEQQNDAMMENADDVRARLT